MQKLWQQLAIATNWPVLVAVGVLSCLGVISIWADSPADGEKQLVFMCIGLVAMALFQAVNYQKIGRYAWPFYFLSLLLILYTVIGTKVTVPGVHNINGACNWITLPGFSIQPAELMKLAWAMVMARYLRFRSNYRTFAGLIPPFLLAFVPLVLILKQPDLGTALIFIPALFAMLFVAGAKAAHLLAIAAIGLVLAPGIWLAGPAPDGPDYPFFRHLPVLVKPYQRARVMAMFSNDPATLQKTGFQQHNALIAFGSGGFAGKGAGVIPVGAHVPESHNDMVFALVGEQFGFVGAAAVLGAYLVLFAAGVEIAGSTREPFGRLVALGVISLLAGQTFLNLMVCIRLMPVTGVTLPFVSYGGSSLLASFMSAGLLLNIGQNRPIVMARDSFDFD